MIYAPSITIYNYVLYKLHTLIVLIHQLIYLYMETQYFQHEQILVNIQSYLMTIYWGYLYNFHVNIVSISNLSLRVKFESQA